MTAEVSEFWNTTDPMLVRRREVARMAELNMTNSEIGAVLGVSRETVRTDAKAMKAKLCYAPRSKGPRCKRCGCRLRDGDQRLASAKELGLDDYCVVSILAGDRGKVVTYPRSEQKVRKVGSELLPDDWDHALEVVSEDAVAMRLRRWMDAARRRLREEAQ